MQHGAFLVIEGTDESGKGTQFMRLAERLEQAGHDVLTVDFPRYHEPSSHFVKQYLNGNYGSIREIGPYVASLFYALDRYEAAPAIYDALKAGKIVVANRFTGSNMAHQGTKLQHAEERRGYFIWLDNLEFQLLGIPRPDVNLVLRVPAGIAQELIDQKAKRTYTEKGRDLHEADLEHLQRSVMVYDDLCELFPKDFIRIDCVRGEKLLTIQDVSNLIWEKIAPLLPIPTPKSKSAAAKATTISDTTIQVTNNPYVEKSKQKLAITKAGHDFLGSVITNVSGNVYAFTDKLSPVTIAAAMARLSRRGDDMRLTLLDEFAFSQGKDEKLLQRIITAYGDDSVQQLAGIHIVVERASNLLTKKLEWGRLAAYLEQSTRYIYFDQKDEEGRYRFHAPYRLDPITRQVYESSMNSIFSLYSVMVHKLTDHIQAKSNTPTEQRDGAWRSATKAQACDLARAVLPVATEATVGVYASGQALESLIMHLLSDELPEAREVGQAILNESRKVMSTFLERADKPDRGGARMAYLANTRNSIGALAEAYLPKGHSRATEPVSLSHFWPRNELDIVADMLYEHSDQSLADIQAKVSSWSYERKVEIFQAYLGERLNRRQRPGRALEKVHYSWDLVCDYGIFRDLQRHRMVDDLEWQMLTPRYGYEIPDLVEEAGLSADFERCFDISLELFSHLQQAGYGIDAQYATLLGHRMRWKMTYNAREAFHIHELRTSPQGHSGYRKLVQAMHEKVAEVHPLFAAGMKFVNQDEDPELARLAAERYAQYKLKLIQ